MIAGDLTELLRKNLFNASLGRFINLYYSQFNIFIII